MEKRINNQITSESFNKLYKKARIIIIALEPSHCGTNDDT